MSYSKNQDMNKEKQITYFIYARKSSESEDRQVASIDSQLSELRKIASEHDLRVVEVFTESKSAKAQGRPVFNEMMARIAKGEASGILCWKLDRLARNFVDGGMIIDMIQNNTIQHIQTNGRGYFPYDNVLMMSVEFGVAKQFIKDLSENTKRGLRKKAESGWMPTIAPIGYVNEKYAEQGNKRILKDEGTFEIVRKCWDLLLTGTWPVERIYKKAITDWNLLTAQRKKPSRSKFYTIFRNTFYYGEYEYAGQKYWGKHEPMLTKAEFEMAQAILDGGSKPNLVTHKFAYTGLMKCGECGAAITAEEKLKKQKNGNKHHYVYYRCSKRLGKCSQKTIRVEKLEKQIQEALDSISIPQEFVDWAMDCIKEENSKEVEARQSIVKNQRKQYDIVVQKIDRLIDMRAGGELTEDEFISKKAELIQEKQRMQEMLTDTDARVDEWLNTAEEAFQFAHSAAKEFPHYSLDGKKQVLATLGSNLILEDRKLRIHMRKLFEPIQGASLEIKNIQDRLEPVQTPMKSDEIVKLYSSSPVLGG